MIFAIIFAQVWGVIQLIVLTSLARTVRVRTVLAAMAVGFYAIGPVTAFLQLSWIRIVAHVFGKAVFDLTGVASYTVDPFIEEAMKLLPLLVLLLIPAIRRQWSVTDCLLIAGATGSGFGLAEHLFRYADYASTAQSVSGGYALTIGSATPLVPGIARTLTSWIPIGVFFAGNAVRVNWHLAWSAICGLAVGLYLRYPKRAARFTAVGVLLLIALDHAAGNAASVEYTWLAWFAALHHLLDSGLAILVLVAIVVAWWLDQPSQRAGMALGPLLAAEQSAPSRLAGTLTAAVGRLPWSIAWVCGFDRSRRAYHAARAAAPGTVDDMRDAIVAERDSVDRRLSQPEAPPLLPPAWMPSNVATTVRSALRRPPVIIWLVLIAPSLLYLIIGGFPATSGLQAVMKGPIVWPIVLLITLFGRGRSVWRVLAGIRRLPAAVRHPIGDDAAMITLQAASGLGTLSLAGFTFARVLSGVGAGERMLSTTAHAADAIGRTQPAGGAAIAGSAGAFNPPPASADPGDAAAAAPAAGAGDGATSSSGDSATSEGSSGDSPQGADRPGHEIPVSEPGGASPTAAPSDGGGTTPLDTETEASGAQAGLAGLAASDIGGAFDPPPPSVQLPDQQPDYDYSPLPPPAPPSSDSPSGYSPLPPPAPPSGESPSDDTQSTESPSDYSSTPAPTPPSSDSPSDDTPLPSPAPASSDTPSGDTQSTESPSDYSSTPAPTPPSSESPSDDTQSTESPSDYSSTPAPTPPSSDSPSPAIPVNDLPDAPPAEPPAIPVNDLPNAPAAEPPVIPVNDLPNAPQAEPPVIAVNDLPDAPSHATTIAPATQADVDAAAAAGKPPATTIAPANQADVDAAAGAGKPPATTIAPATQADVDAAAGAGKPPATTIAPASQADIDAATGKVAVPAPTITPVGPQDAGAAAGSPDTEATGTGSPDSPPPPKPAAPTQAQMDQLARSEQADDDAVAAQKARSEQADDDAVAAQNAADDAGRAADHIPTASGAGTPGSAPVQAAHLQAADAAIAAKAATDPLGAAADAAQRDLAAAQQRENDAFFNKDAKAYHDARAALDAARQKAADAQAAADAAKKGSGSDTIASSKKP